jgi:hypothetical protein
MRWRAMGWRTSMPKRYAAPRVGGTKPSRTLMVRGFARAVRAEKAEDFAGIHLQIETAQGDFGCLPEFTAGEFDAQFFRF